MLHDVFTADSLRVKSDVVIVLCEVVRGLQVRRRGLSARFLEPTLVKHALDASYAAAAPARTVVL